jgi:hypothetical protein
MPISRHAPISVPLKAAGRHLAGKSRQNTIETGGLRLEPNPTRRNDWFGMVDRVVARQAAKKEPSCGGQDGFNGGL